MVNRRAFAATACGAVAAAAAILALPVLARAQVIPEQSYPERTVRIIVPTAAGGSIDTTARVVAAALAERWGRPVVIENRPGAAMIIGAEAAAKSPPDGYTLLVAHDGTMAMNPLVYPNLAYHSQRDFEPLALLTAIPEVVLVNAALPVKSIRELIAFAKANPGKLNHASGGTATLLALELFKAMAEVDITNVPFRGGAPAVTGVMSGATQVIFADLATANAGMQSGKLRTLAVTTRKRVPRLPDVPTIDESGVPGYDVATWIGAFAPAGTPKAILDKIEATIKQALAAPDVKAKLEALSMEVRSGASAELRAVLAGDMDKWGRLVREKNIRIAQ
jgi:tripartite-type tricarboxylate transporter receptor subunit TctC